MQKKYKIAVLIPVWKRNEIFKLSLESLKILQASGMHKFMFYFVLSIEDEEHAQNLQAIKESGLNAMALQYRNDFLGAKLNYGIMEIRQNPYDYIMNFGSDDLIHTDIFKLYAPYLGKADILGIDTCHFYANENDITRIKYYNYQRAVGAGRLISKKVIDTIYKAKEHVYTEYLNRGLDGDSCANFTRHGFKETIVNTECPYIVDIKSQTNINPYHEIKAHPKGEAIPYSYLETYYPSIMPKIKKGFAQPQKQVKEAPNKQGVKTIVLKELRNGIIRRCPETMETLLSMQNGINVVPTESEMLVFLAKEKELKDLTTKELKPVTTK